MTTAFRGEGPPNALALPRQRRIAAILRQTAEAVERQHAYAIAQLMREAARELESTSNERKGE